MNPIVTINNVLIFIKILPYVRYPSEELGLKPGHATWPPVRDHRQITYISNNQFPYLKIGDNDTLVCTEESMKQHMLY